MPKLPFDAPSQQLSGVAFPFDQKTQQSFALTTGEAQARLGQHMSVLEAVGKKELGALGRLSIGLGKPGTILQTPGVVLPGDTGSRPYVLKGGAAKLGTDGRFQKLAGGAVVLEGRPLPIPANLALVASIVPLSLAYWFGTEIILEDDTTVVIAPEVKALVVIAESLKIGKGVTFSWERPVAVPPNQPAKPSAQAAYSPNRADGLSALRGRDGSVGGTPGIPAPSGQPAPELELWFLNATGFPAIDLRGQDGYQGVRGGDGGDGGPGQHGCNSKTNWGLCSQEAGQGGDGGNGGRAGDGGRGGDGGLGGRFSAFAPQPQITAWLQSGLTISVDGGSAGSGGDPGQQGEGGPGGDKGSTIHSLCPRNNRTGGARGRAGAPGSRGPEGKPGILQPNSIRYTAITSSDFYIQTAKPAVISLAPAAAFVGDTVSVNGLRFSTGDVVMIEGFDGQVNVPCQTTFISETLVTFKVNAVPGGFASCAVQQVDGTRSSSQGTLNIRPKIESVVPLGRIRPGEHYFLKGSGFGRDGAVWLNGEGASQFQYVDANTIKFKAARPFSIQANEAGEKAKLRVVNTEGAAPGNPNHSGEIDVILDTYRVLAFGDSVMWGGGLPEHQKFYALAASYMATKLERIGVYTSVEAHHGAKIGRGDSTVKPKIPGELSTRWPTILQQVEKMAAMPDASEVDLILVDGGANDLPITNFTMQTTPAQLNDRIQELIAKAKQYCRDDMAFMLTKIVSAFPKARVIVTGYFHIFSAESKSPLLAKVIIGLMGLSPAMRHESRHSWLSGLKSAGQ